MKLNAQDLDIAKEMLTQAKEALNPVGVKYTDLSQASKERTGSKLQKAQSEIITSNRTNDLRSELTRAKSEGSLTENEKYLSQHLSRHPSQTVLTSSYNRIQAKGADLTLPDLQRYCDMAYEVKTKESTGASYSKETAEGLLLDNFIYELSQEQIHSPVKTAEPKIPIRNMFGKSAQIIKDAFSSLGLKWNQARKGVDDVKPKNLQKQLFQAIKDDKINEFIASNLNSDPKLAEHKDELTNKILGVMTAKPNGGDKSIIEMMQEQVKKSDGFAPKDISKAFILFFTGVVCAARFLADAGVMVGAKTSGFVLGSVAAVSAIVGGALAGVAKAPFFEDPFADFGKNVKGAFDWTREATDNLISCPLALLESKIITPAINTAYDKIKNDDQDRRQNFEKQVKKIMLDVQKSFEQPLDGKEYSRPTIKSDPKLRSI